MDWFQFNVLYPSHFIFFCIRRRHRHTAQLHTRSQCTLGPSWKFKNELRSILCSFFCSLLLLLLMLMKFGGTICCRSQGRQVKNVVFADIIHATSRPFTRTNGWPTILISIIKFCFYFRRTAAASSLSYRITQHQSTDSPQFNIISGPGRYCACVSTRNSH